VKRGFERSKTWQDDVVDHRCGPTACGDTQRYSNGVFAPLSGDATLTTKNRSQRWSTGLEENLDHPLGPFLYAASVLHCMTVSLSQGGAGLGTMWGEQTARQMLREAGFKNVTTKKFEPDIEHVYYTCAKL